MSWFPGDTCPLVHRSISKLLSPEHPVLLFCRRRQGRPYFFCGTLRAAALVPGAADEYTDAVTAAARATDQGGDPLPVWALDSSREGAPTAAHVVWRLEQGGELMRNVTVEEGGGMDAASTLWGDGAKAGQTLQPGQLELIRSGRPDWYFR